MPDHHQAVDPPKMAAERGQICTLDDLRAFLATSPEVPDGARPRLRSAVKRAADLTGKGAPDVKLEPKALLKKLSGVSPAAAGLTRAGLANLKSAVRAALRFATPHLGTARSSTRVAGPWADLAARLPLTLQRQSSRIMRFAQDRGIAPEKLDESAVQAFADHLEKDLMLPHAEEVVRRTRLALIKAAKLLPDWPCQTVASAQLRRTPYWISMDQLPGLLRQEISAWLGHRGDPDPFSDHGRVVAPSTLTQYTYAFITLASARSRRACRWSSSPRSPFWSRRPT